MKPGGMGAGEVAGWGEEETSSPATLTKEGAQSDMVQKQFKIHSISQSTVLQN